MLEQNEEKLSRLRSLRGFGTRKVDSELSKFTDALYSKGLLEFLGVDFPSQ